MRVGDVVRSSLELGDPNSGFSLAPNAYGNMSDLPYLRMKELFADEEEVNNNEKWLEARLSSLE